MNKKYLLLFVLSMITLVSIASAETLFNDTTTVDNPITSYYSADSPRNFSSVVNVWWYINNVTALLTSSGGFTESAFVQFDYVDGSSSNSSVKTTTTALTAVFDNPSNSSLVKKVRLHWKTSSAGASATISNVYGSGINGTNSLTIIDVSVKNITSNSIIENSVTLNYESTTNISNQVTYTSIGRINNTKIGLIPDTYNVLITSSGYSNTNLYSTITSNNTIIYYMNSLPVTSRIIYVKNSYGQFLEGITVEVLRQSDDALLYSGVTDLAGQAQFNLATSGIFNVRVNAVGYDPVLSSYNAIDNLIITLSSSINNNVSKYSGFNYNFSPSQSYLLNNTFVNINFNVSSSYFNITSCNMTILNNASVVLNSTSVNFCNNRTGTKILNVYPNNTDRVTVLGTIVVNGEIFSFINTYTVKYYYQGQFSLKSGLEGISGFDKGGFDSFGKGLFLIIITFMIVGSAIRFSPNVIDRPESTFLLITLILAMWTISGFFADMWISEWLPFIFSAIGTAILYKKNWSER